MGCYMETAKATVDYLRDEKGIKAGCLTVFVLPAVPGHGRSSRRSRTAKAFTVFERMDDPLSTTGNHLTREIKAAFCDADDRPERPGADRPRAADLSAASAGLGSRDVRPGDIIAVFENMIDDGPDFFCVGIDHALALTVTRGPRSAADRRLLDARPLGRRLRLGDDQQGHRHDRRRRLRQGRAGLSEVRLGEEGPADDVLPDDRRLAHLHAQRAGARRPGRAQRPDGDPQRRPARRGWCRAARSSCSRRTPTRPTSGSGFPTHNQQTIREKKLRVYFCRHGQDRPRGRLARPTCRCACRASCCWARSSSSRRTPTQSRDDRRAGLRGRREGAAQVLRQARRPRRAGQPHLREARLQRDAGESRAESSMPEPSPARLAPVVTGARPVAQPDPSFAYDRTAPRRSRCRRPSPQPSPR